MVKENIIPIEIVQEIENYQIKKSPLSLAARGKVVNKSGSNFLSENKKSYGPCNSCGNDDLTFKLEITLRKWDGSYIVGTVFSTKDAERAAREIRNGTGFWAGSFKTGPFSDESRNGLANQVINYVDIHKNGKKVDTTTSYEDSCSIM